MAYIPPIYGTSCEQEYCPYMVAHLVSKNSDFDVCVCESTCV